MKKILFIFGLIFGVSAVAGAQEWTKSWARWSESKRLSFSLSGGMNFFGFKTQHPSHYLDQWDYDQLAKVNESADIIFRKTTGFSGGVSLEYLMSPEFSLQFLIGYRKTPLETISNTSFAWRWKDGRFDSRSTTWIGGEGSLSTVPVVLRGVFRIPVGDLFFIRFLAGAGLFYHELSDTFSTIEYGITKTDPVAKMQYIDALGVSIKIGKVHWTNWGGSAGAGIDIPLGNSLGLTLDLEYFLIPPKEVRWAPVPGISDGLYFSSDFPILKGVEFTAEDAAEITKSWKISKMDIQPSYVQASVGFRLTLGR